VRLHALVTKVADDAIAAARRSDALISALSVHLPVRRSARASAELDSTAR